MNGNSKPYPPGVTDKLVNAYRDLQWCLQVCRNPANLATTEVQQELAAIHSRTELLRIFVVQDCNGTIAS